MAAANKSDAVAEPPGETPSTVDESKAIDELKKLFAETIDIDVDFNRKFYFIQKGYERKYHELYDKRMKILKNYRKKIGAGDTEDALDNFWLKVLKASGKVFISQDDENILKHLIDIRTVLINMPSNRFQVEFRFLPNPYFANQILTKTYFLTSLPDKDNPLSFMGSEICKCEGCYIDWNEDQHAKINANKSSFFDYFSPPVLPEDIEDPNYEDITDVLQADFELGYHYKEKIIPKAILYFTGEVDEDGNYCSSDSS